MEKIDKILQDQTTKCSEVSRKIVFALYAVSWGLSFIINKGINITLLFIIVILLLTVYLFIDVFQYWYTTYRNEKLYSFLEKISRLDVDMNRDNVENYTNEEMRKISYISHILFHTKIVLLFISFVCLVIAILDKYPLKIV